MQATSEPLNALEHNLAWKPSGSLIASTERLPNKYQVSLFEKNGLRHGEFTLPFGKDEVVVTHLSWNKDSEALLVASKCVQECFPQPSYIQIYTCSNYHWSLKQSWVQNEDIVYIQWDTIHALR